MFVISRLLCKVYAGHMFPTQHQLCTGMHAVHEAIQITITECINNAILLMIYIMTDQ
jgi:hypothetical protein